MTNVKASTSVCMDGMELNGDCREFEISIVKSSSHRLCVCVFVSHSFEYCALPLSMWI